MNDTKETILERLKKDAGIGDGLDRLGADYPGVLGLYLDLFAEHPCLETVAAPIFQAYMAILRCFDDGGTLFICGNGGSFADAAHITGELLKAFERNRHLTEEEQKAFAGLPYGEDVGKQLEHGFRAVVLGNNAVLASAVLNDFSMANMHYAQELYAMARKGDVLIGISTSGNARNVMYAMTTAAQFVVSGLSKKALVVGSEIMSRTIDPSDPKTYPLFGDGAGAALLVPAPTQGPQASGLLAYTLGAEGCGGEMLCIPGGGSRLPITADNVDSGLQYLRMEGRSVFKWAVRVVEDSCTDVLGYCGVHPSRLAQIILHQANIRIIDAAVSDFGVDRSSVFVNLDRFGNTSAASIPLAIDEAIAQGKIQRNDLVLLCGFGAGLSWGTGVMRW